MGVNSTYFITSVSEMGYYVVLTDYSYWMDCEEQLKAWCNKNLIMGEDALKGSLIQLANEKEYVLFELRWS